MTQVPGGQTQVQRKRRTREHIIEDLSRNHFEKYVLRCGHEIEAMRRDYGVDGVLYSHDGTTGEIEEGCILVQFKATDKPNYLARSEGTISFSLDKADLLHWTKEYSPVILVLYDAQKDQAFWLNIQETYTRESVADLPDHPTVHLSTSMPVSETAITSMVAKKNLIQERISEMLRKGAMLDGA